MKKLILPMLALLLITFTASAQTNITFKTRYRIYIPGNEKFSIIYSWLKKNKEKPSGTIYHPNSILVDTFKTISEIYIGGDTVKAKRYDFLVNHRFLYADLVQSDDKEKIYIYFWPFGSQSNQGDGVDIKKELSASELKFNQDIDKGIFYINLKSRQTLSISKAALQAGPLTIPFKIYLTSRDTGRANNISTAVSAGAYFGWKFGKQSFSNMPADKVGKSHERFVSLNFIGGFSKIDISAKTNINSDTREGTALGFSPALGLGYHYDSFAIFVAAGTDIPFGNITENWRYKYQPWIGFGIGFSIL